MIPAEMHQGPSCPHAITVALYSVSQVLYDMGKTVRSMGDTPKNCSWRWSDLVPDKIW